MFDKRSISTEIKEIMVNQVRITASDNMKNINLLTNQLNSFAAK